METIRIGIVGYGNVGRGVELAVGANPDMRLEGVFTRRSPGSVTVMDASVPVMHVSEAAGKREDIDVMILAGGSATDLPVQGPEFAALFNVVDSYDTHAKIPEYFESVDRAARGASRVAVIAAGWDPGLFSMNRVIAGALLPSGACHTFWGRGVSQGHSDAIRRIKGVTGGVQYTIPLEEAMHKARVGESPGLSSKEMHLRDCYVVVEEGADRARIEREIQTMPYYFAEYETRVTFVTGEELRAKHSSMPHGGFVIGSGRTGRQGSSNQVMEFSLKLDSNPEFTACVLTAYARAAYRMHREGQEGAKTVFDVPVGHLSPKSPAELRKELL